MIIQYRQTPSDAIRPGEWLFMVLAPTRGGELYARRRALTAPIGVGTADVDVSSSMSPRGRRGVEMRVARVKAACGGAAATLATLGVLSGGCPSSAGASGPGVPAPSSGPSPAGTILKSGVTRSSFGRLPNGTPVDLFTLTNANGLEIRTIPYGAIIVSARVPDRTGRLDDVVSGFDTLEGYLGGHPYFGAVVGRYGNRIAKGRFTLDGKTFQLATNNGANHLHGGVKGFDKQLWRGEPVARNGDAGVSYTLTSRDGDEGYPGTLNVRVTYTLRPSNELVIDYEATADRATPINLTQHSYFNLAGDGNGDILGHELTIDADRFTPVDEGLIPTGELASVEGTPFDFRRSAAIGARINADNAQIRYGKGYDHNWVLNHHESSSSSSSFSAAPVHAVRLVEPQSGRTLDVATTEPGVQFYSGNFLDGTIRGKSGRVYQQRHGLCLETQHFPDSPNHSNFPSTILRPGGRYRTRTIFTFGVAKR
jgi:aldose 1-epimerase